MAHLYDGDFMYQVHLIVLGKVQGVFYRASCQDVAVKYGLHGWVKNLYTGEVEAVAQGEKEKLEKFIEWCKKGPPHADVSGTEVQWEEVTEVFNGFGIK